MLNYVYTTVYYNVTTLPDLLFWARNVYSARAMPLALGASFCLVLLDDFVTITPR